MIRILYVLLFLALATALPAQNVLAEIIEANRDSFGEWADNPDRYEVQVLYSRIERENDGKVSLTTDHWGSDPSRYFYPASTVKLPAAILALQRINELGVSGLTPKTALFHGTGTAPAAAPQTAVFADSTSQTGWPSVEHYIRKILLVSDNDAYNRLFEWLGPTYINESLEEVGIGGSRVIHRVGVGGFDTESHAWLNPVKFVNGPEVPFRIGERHDTFYRALPEIGSQTKGVGYTTNEGKLVNESFDFGHKNYLSVKALHDIVARVTVPEAFTPEQRFNLTEADYELLRRAMSERPRESITPVYDKPDNYGKFWAFGDRPDETIIPNELRILNKVGWAYGTLTDAAYIIDEATGVEFILVGTILVNDNGIFNDGVYEYEETGLPFFGELGRAVLEHERARAR